MENRCHSVFFASVQQLDVFWSRMLDINTITEKWSLLVSAKLPRFLKRDEHQHRDGEKVIASTSKTSQVPKQINIELPRMVDGASTVLFVSPYNWKLEVDVCWIFKSVPRLRY